MDKKLEKLNKMLELMNNETLTPKDVEKFLTFVLSFVQKSKESIESMSSEHINQMKDILVYVEEEHAKFLTKVDEKDEEKEERFNAKLSEVKSLLEEIKKIEVKDGKDADEEVIVEKVLSQIKLPEYKETVLDTGAEIVAKINDLDTDDEDLLIDAIHIKNLPKFVQNQVGGVVARNIYQMGDVALSSLSNGQILKWNSTNNRWENGTDSGGASTLAQISAGSLTTPDSLYTMTSTIPVEFRSSDGNPILYLDETNERIGIGTNTPSDLLSLSGNSATRIGTTWVNTNSSPSTSAFLGAYSGNMQMGTVSNHPFYLETNNTVRISIAAAGNIGIGLNSGSAKLHVLATTEQLRLGYDASNYASFTVTSGGLLNIAPTGTNVGINVASPSSPLHVNGAIRSQRTGTATQNIVLDGGDSGAIYLTASSTTGGQKILRFRNLVTGGAATDATNQFAWDLNTDSSILQIATLSFGSGFKVNRSNTTTQFLSVNGGDSSGIYLTGQSNTGGAEKFLYISNFTNGTATSANGMRFRVGDVGTPVTAATIDYLGNVGIGVSPNHRLDTYLSSSSTGVSTIYGLRDIPSGTISSGSSINGIFGQVTVSGSSTISNVIPTAGRFIAEHDGSSTVGGVYGVYAHARTNAASTGVLANAYSIYAVAPNNNQAGNTITNAYSLYIESPTAGATLNYGLYQTGSANNYFGGKVGIGLTAPTAVLHLKAGTATASTAPLKFTSGTNLTTAEAGAMEYNGTNLFFTRTGTTRETVNTTVTKTDTGDGTGAEGLFQINTFDNTFKVYAEGAWRTLATW